MKQKKFIPVSLILILALQLLPVKQAVRYFFVDNPIVEELLHVNKNATKNFRLVDEDHFISDADHFIPGFFLISNIAFLQYAEMLPVLPVTDIQTPPPNIDISIVCLIVS